MILLTEDTDLGIAEDFFDDTVLDFVDDTAEDTVLDTVWMPVSPLQAVHGVHDCVEAPPVSPTSC